MIVWIIEKYCFDPFLLNYNRLKDRVYERERERGGERERGNKGGRGGGG